MSVKVKNRVTPAFPPGASDEGTDPEAYKDLFASVIELAFKDYESLIQLRSQRRITPSGHKKLRALTEDGDPEEFFASSWFEDICQMIGITAAVIRKRLEEIG